MDTANGFKEVHPAGDAGQEQETGGVAELLRTERRTDAGFQAAQAAEMEQRQAVIKQQQEEAQRQKKQRREAQHRAQAVAEQQQVRSALHWASNCILANSCQR